MQLNCASDLTPRHIQVFPPILSTSYSHPPNTGEDAETDSFPLFVPPSTPKAPHRLVRKKKSAKSCNQIFRDSGIETELEKAVDDLENTEERRRWQQDQNRQDCCDFAISKLSKLALSPWPNLLKEDYWVGPWYAAWKKKDNVHCSGGSPMQEQRSESSWKICWKQRNGEIMGAIIRAFPITDNLFTYFDQNNLLGKLSFTF